jgi:YVTN family beta-propeller protein
VLGRRCITFPRPVRIPNKIYVANFSSDNVTVIDGATNTATTVNASGNEPMALAVNPLTNKIYVVNAASSTVTVIDGATNATTSIVVETAGNPQAVAVNPVTNQIYVANFNSKDITVIDGVTNATSIVPVSEHRCECEGVRSCGWRLKLEQDQIQLTVRVQIGGEYLCEIVRKRIRSGRRGKRAVSVPGKKT